MAKPSIFSSNYDRQMKIRKKRKRKISILVIVLILVTIVGINAIDFNNFSSKIVSRISTLGNKLTASEDKNQNIAEDKNENKTDDKIEDKAEDVISEEDSEEEATTEVVEETKTKEIPIDINQSVGATVTIDNETNKIEKVVPNNENTYFQISDTKSSGLLYDKSAQMVYIFNSSGNIKDITYKQYMSTKGNITRREEVVPSRKDFIWMGTPKFIDDNTIVYKSFLPWFTSVNYIWVFNNTTNEYKTVQLNNKLLGGGNVEILDKVEDGIKVTVDGTNYKVTANALATSM